MRVLGVDPGLRELGWAVIEPRAGRNGQKRYAVVSCGVITTSDKSEFAERLFEIGLRLHRIMRRFKPDLCALESVFVWKDPASALKLGMVLGMCVEISRRQNVRVKILSPLFIKSRVSGDRYADKDSVRKAVVRRIRRGGLEGLDGKSVPHHITDAIAVALSSVL